MGGPRFVFAHKRFGVEVFFDTKNDKLVVLGTLLPVQEDGRIAFREELFLWTGWPRKGRSCRGMYTQPLDPEKQPLIVIKDWVEKPLYSTVVF